MNKKPKVCAGIILCMFLLSLSVPAFSKTTDSSVDEQVIRVGFMNTENFLQINSNGHANGYCAEYLDKIAEYTGWKYKFVYGSWSECLNWLETGKIDLLMPAEYSKERAKNFLYSKEMCYMDYSILVGHKDNDSLYYGDIEAFDGMKVGMIVGNDLNNLFRSYQKKNGFSVNTVYYENEAKLNNALNEGKVDAAVNGSMNFSPSQKILAKIDYKPAYFIMSKNNKALMAQLDDAQHSIMLDYPTYTSDLYKKYYSQMERQAVDFTQEEYDYIQNAKTIRVLYETNDYPLEYQDSVTRNGKGLYVDILSTIFQECGLTYQLVPCDSNKSSWEQIAQGDGDILLSTYNSIENREKYNLSFTDGYYTANYNLVGRRRSSMNLEDNLKVAIIDRNEGEKSLLRKVHSNWKQIGCASVRECLERVDNGDADIAFVNSLSLEIHQATSPNNNLIIFTASDLSIPISLGLADKTDPILKSVLNKAIKKLDTQNIQQSVLNNILTAHSTPSISFYIHTYPVHSVIVITAVFLLFAFIFFFYFISRKNHKQNLILQAKNKELEEAINLQCKLQVESEQDPLTGLKNKKTSRSLCINTLKNLGSKKCALIIVDVDNFKFVNDTYGHLAGDDALKQVASHLQHVFALGIASRIGGDEFLAMTPLLDDRSQLDPYLNEFCQRMKEVKIEDHPITCSIGVAVSKSGDNLYKDMFARADQALYTAKRNGKNQYAVVE